MNLLVVLLALLGHGYMLMLSLNFIYSLPLNRIALKILRQICGLALVVIPVGFAVFVGTDLVNVIEGDASVVAAVYAWICLVAGSAFIGVTLLRLLRRPPAALLRERSVIVDVVKELGHRPVGDGKHRHVASFALNDIFRVQFSELEIQISGLPQAWDGLSILHLSDVHFYGTPAREYYEFVIRRAMADGTPDLLAISGDILDGDEYLEWIEPVFGPLKWNVAALAIMGNHDWWQDYSGARERLASLGMTILDNHWQSIEVRGEPLIAIGHEGPWFRPPPDLHDAPEGFRLLVSHTPDNIGWAKKNGCRLMLSGHNHGGQIRLPILGSLFVPSKFSRKYDMGTYHEEPTVLHVNRGLSGKEPIRFRCLPQVSRIILKSAPIEKMA